MIRRLEIVVLPALLLALIALPIPLLADRLPDPIATHWAFDGQPDGSLDPSVLWSAVTAVWLVLWAVLAVRSRAGGHLPEAVPVLGVGGFLAALMGVTAIANDGAATWREAGEVGPLAALAAVAAGWLLVGSAVAVALAVITASSVRVTASERGLQIAFGPFGVPSNRLPLERIERAEAADIEPLRWGGWGYRWAGPGRSAVVVRRGPGLVIDLRGGRRFAVTVDEPAPAAGLVNDLLRRRAAG
jgi:hypothetical protein